jgi:hypothetical protein
VGLQGSRALPPRQTSPIRTIEGWALQSLSRKYCHPVQVHTDDSCPLELSRNDSFKAIETLQAAAPGAHLAAHRGREAAAEFQKILDHSGIVVNRPVGALAHLGLARAYAMQGDTAKPGLRIRLF